MSSLDYADKTQKESNEKTPTHANQANNITIDDNDELLFLDEEIDESEIGSNGVWKVLIVDDDEEVHSITKLVLRDFEFDGRKLEFISAYSSKEAKEIISKSSDIAIIFLDIIMESENSGLEVIHYIRHIIKNKMVRIILRTGQPGHTPEEQAILNYDINDYKEKTELTSKKLFTCVVTALRSYRDLVLLDLSRRGLEKVIESSRMMFINSGAPDFAQEVLYQLEELYYNDSRLENKNISALVSTKIGENYIVRIGNGEFKDAIGKSVCDIIPDDIKNNLKCSFIDKKVEYYKNYFIAHFFSENENNLVVVKTESDLNEWEKDILAIFFTNIAIAYDNMLIAKEIDSTQQEIFLTLGEIAEARSKETGQHVKRVAEFSYLLALKYGLKPEEAELLKKASPMHDIGKIAIPDFVLNKPGKLTSEEYEIMKTHSRIGYEMLKNSKRPIMKAAAIIAFQHHEKYDGTGYPMGLIGEDIHVYGRITAVADVFDALGCKRVYKKAWPLEDILKYFEEQRGKHFEPKLVDILFDNIDEFMKIKNNFPD